MPYFFIFSITPSSGAIPSTQESAAIPCPSHKHKIASSLLPAGRLAMTEKIDIISSETNY